MIERGIYLAVALATAGLTWLLADVTYRNFSKPAETEPIAALLYWAPIAATFMLALITGVASLFFLMLVAWGVESPDDYLKDSHWCELLFREHPKRQLREWARSMRYFRFIRGQGGGMGDYGDRLAIAFKAGSRQDVKQILAALGAEHASVSESHSAVLLGGVKVDVYEIPGRLELAITDTEKPFEVTQAAVDSARSVERFLERVADKLVDPPQNDKYCISPKFYPSFWQDPNAAIHLKRSAPVRLSKAQRRRKRAFRKKSLIAALLLVALLAWIHMNFPALRASFFPIE